MSADWCDHAVKAMKGHKPPCDDPCERVYEGIVIDGPCAGERRRVPGYVSHSLTEDGLRYGRIEIRDHYNGRGADVGFWYDPKEAECRGLTPQAHALLWMRDRAGARDLRTYPPAHRRRP